MQIRNRIAFAYWTIVFAFLAIVLAMTYVLLRDGAPEGYSPLFMAGVLGLFWLFGLGAAAYAFSHPIVRIEVTAGGLDLSLRTPFSRFQRRYRPHEIRKAEIIQTEDSEGDPYFLAKVTLVDEHSFNLAEGACREDCQQALATLMRVLHGSDSEKYPGLSSPR